MKLFSINKKQFVYQSDTQLVEALRAGQQAAFDYVFNRYHELLQSNIKSAFHIKEKDKVERLFKKRCGELQDYFLVDNCAKLKLFDQSNSTFDVWLAVTSLSFFKRSFCDENKALVERYRKCDKSIVYERYRSNFEMMVRKTGETNGDTVRDEAIILSDDLYMQLVKDNCKKLNTYNPTQQTFDAWFGWVLHNFAIDQYKDKIKKSNKDVYDIVYNKKNEQEAIEQWGFFRIDEQNTFPGWEQQIRTIDDEEKLEIMNKVRKTVETLQPPRYRDILVDKFYKGEDYEVIAQRYQVTIANAQNIVSRALKRLRETLEKNGLRIKR